MLEVIVVIVALLLGPVLVVVAEACGFSVEEFAILAFLVFLLLFVVGGLEVYVWWNYPLYALLGHIGGALYILCWVAICKWMASNSDTENMGYSHAALFYSPQEPDEPEDRRCGTCEHWAHDPSLTAAYSTSADPIGRGKLGACAKSVPRLAASGNDCPCWRRKEG